MLQAGQQSGGAVLELDLLQIRLTAQEVRCMDLKMLSVIWQVRLPFPRQRDLVA